MPASAQFASRFACIHGHFYQPPRENPWTGRVEREPSAQPFHDWNARITAECYAANVAARVLDAEGALIATLNNYAHISFDFGPTLLSWLETAAPEVYTAVQVADRTAHGAMAQGYNHMILPLANARDRATQVLWGRRDFQFRFGREPEGLWLPETAVNIPTLEDLAAAGIQFTLLAPRQARRVRSFGSRQWHDVVGGRVDTRFPYEVRLPSERRIAVFFYNAEIAQGVAFGGLLNDGRELAAGLVQATVPGASDPQLASVATDGESYGHHHPLGEMALAAAVRALETHPAVAPVNYRAFLALHPPTREVELVEDSSWSCIHGVERWRADCGCNSGGNPGWHQAWRSPLRAALDWLRDQLSVEFERAASLWFWDVWAARNEYIEVVLDPSPTVWTGFVARHSRYPLNHRELAQARALLQMQRCAMLMYTSCGWFFDDISGIEAAQVLAYAARAVELAEAACDWRQRSGFLQRLEEAPSNLPQFATGRGVLEALWRGRPPSPVQAG